jgi:hypothetical protein
MPKPSKEQRAAENKRYMERVKSDPDRLKRFQATQRKLQAQYRKNNKNCSFLKVRYNWCSFDKKYFIWKEEHLCVSTCSSKDFREWMHFQHLIVPDDLVYLLEPDYETDLLERWVICNSTLAALL